MTIPYTLIILLAFGGFLIANYIRQHKYRGKALVCPIGHACDPVIHSEYSRFLGIPLEFMGMGYYGLVTVAYLFFALGPGLPHITASFIILALTAAALLFSIYLTFIQAFVLRQWCTWCLISAGLCVFIFALALSGSGYGFITLLAEHHAVFLGLHLLGIAFGLGGATISDVMFFKFLKDLRISTAEKEVLATLSQVIWFGLAVLVLSGLGLYLPESVELNQSAKFLVKMIVVWVIIINGAFLNLLIAPNLVKISFGLSHAHMPGELHRIRKLSFAMGAVSLVSWYSAFVLGLLRTSPASFGVILGAYVVLILLGVAISQLVERQVSKQPMV